MMNYWQLYGKHNLKKRRKCNIGRLCIEQPRPQVFSRSKTEASLENSRPCSVLCVGLEKNK